MNASEAGVTMEAYLRQHADKIACTACGRCCPTSCAFKKDTSCDIHPKKIGREARMPLCMRSPVEFFLDHGIACEPVLDVVKTLTDITPDVMEQRYPFPHPYRDLPGCTYVDPIDHAKIRGTVIHPPSPLHQSFIPLHSVQIFNESQ